MIRVLVVDDSTTTRALLTAILQSDPMIRVVGQAVNGIEAVRLTQDLKPDLITMDIRMPEMDGLEATARILEVCPTPIIVVSMGVNDPDLKISFNALKVGALDVVEKPVGQTHKDYESIRERLVWAVKTMSEVKVIRRRPLNLPHVPTPPRDLADRRGLSIVAIGSSTGGPAVLNAILKSLPIDFPLPIVIVQHMSVGFMQGLVDWLRSDSKLPLSVVQSRVTVRPGHVYFAPDTRHVEFLSRGILVAVDGPQVSFVKPSATVLFRSVARVYGPEAIGVILTGMGDDGAIGLREMRDRGAVTIGQDEASCVVYGMPKIAVEIGAVEHSLSPGAIVSTCLDLARNGVPQRSRSDSP